MMNPEINAKKWFVVILAGVVLILSVAAGITIYLDPFFHYHQPHTDKYFYPLNNERSQCDGIAKQFDYDGILIGTSSAENFKTSEAEALFGGNFIKLTLSGGTYKEFNNLLTNAFAWHPDIKTVIRVLDIGVFFFDKDRMRTDMGDFPTYLYNRNPFDDVYYVFNRDILFTRCYTMLKDRNEGKEGGITSFDKFSYWMAQSVGLFGKNTVLVDTEPFYPPETITPITDEDRTTVRENITQNVTALCEQYPDTTFCFMLSPFSAAWWGAEWQEGRLDRQIDAEQIVLELMLEHDNIRVYSLSCFPEITCDLNNYTDAGHYSERINTLILQSIHDGTGLITKENYLEYLEKERTFYNTFEYNSMFLQEDLEDPPADLP